MKYVALIGDGMADTPLQELGGKTPLQAAATPNMDRLAQTGVVGKAHTIPEGFHPGSDVANLSILGYDPRQYYTGRAPLEAASIGIELADNDIAFRCNLVTLKFDPGKTRAVMDDYSSGHITTAEATELIKSVYAAFGTEELRFYPGVSYRHLMIWRGGSSKAECVPPHDILEREITDYLPVGEGEELLRDLMRRSVPLLEAHPVNEARISAGKKPANSIWLWGQGGRPQLPTYRDKYGLSGALISAVDLTKGLGIYAGFNILNVPGATGWIDTNYTGKAEYALDALKEVDFVYVHVESPDEAGHSGDYRNKLKAIEDFDAKVVGPVMRGLAERFGDHRILLMPDHATPIKARTHTDVPVPFVVYDSRVKKDTAGVTYNESILDRPDILVFRDGFRLMDHFIKEV